MAIHQSASLFANDWKWKLLKHDSQAREIIEVRWKVQEAPNSNPETNFQHQTNHKQQTVTIFHFPIKLILSIFSFLISLTSKTFNA